MEETREGLTIRAVSLVCDCYRTERPTEHVLRRIRERKERLKGGEGSQIELLFRLRLGNLKDVREDERQKPGILHLFKETREDLALAQPVGEIWEDAEKTAEECRLLLLRLRAEGRPVEKKQR